MIRYHPIHQMWIDILTVELTESMMAIQLVISSSEQWIMIPRALDDTNDGIGIIGVLLIHKNYW